MNKELIAIAILMLILGIAITNAYYTLKEPSYFNVNNLSANGFYSDSGYFCVATNNRDLDEIMRITMHELSHIMIEEERVHFNIK